MNVNIAVQLLQLALSLIQKKSGDSLAKTLLDIVRTADQLYQKETGKPMDLSLIKKEPAA
jgi:hypothetical protein